ncbi:hypothetical protein CHI95_21870 [Providencia rettgeri]|jgi:hypothetical protein|uniref:Uncharacterized protein n=2 Tax=Providencia TaxID=586 RepID=A0A899NNE9_PROST|nr:hypothetical protein [Providencia sp. PROV001]OZS72433.1 hypothetical protein CHI95_21870 [Providencia rettgeri]QSM62520.1 hypothetical protein EKPLLCFL_00285 [Providencia stuartii]UII02408.1 hypothetical protein [Providencia rettgeri]URQ57386.1 Hypothetical protein [Providencia alcalifaciens]
MRSGGLYFRFFHYALLISLLFGCILFGKALISIYWPRYWVPADAWYAFGIAPGVWLATLIGLIIFIFLSSLYRYFGVLVMTTCIACAGIAFFVLNS